MSMGLLSSQLEAFAAVARNRNFTKAALELNISQSALSQRILNLESEVSTTLFLREKTGIELTDAAHELLRFWQIQKSMEEEFLGSIKSQNQGELAGTIRIAGYSTVMRSLIIPSFKSILQKNPKVRIQAQTRELNELESLLRSGEADYILLDHTLEREGIESYMIGKERYVLIEPKGYRGPENVYLDHDENDETTRNYLKKAGLDIQKMSRHYLDDIYGIIDGVRAGMGKAVVPEHLLEGLRGVEIRGSKVTLDVPIVLNFYKRPFYTQLHRRVLEALLRKS